MANNYSIALLSEPYVGSNTTAHHIQGVDIHQFSTIEHVKACVLIKQTFGDSIGLTQLSTSNLAVVQLKVGQRKFHVASAYVEPDIDKKQHNGLFDQTFARNARLHVGYWWRLQW